MGKKIFIYVFLIIITVSGSALSSIRLETGYLNRQGDKIELSNGVIIQQDNIRLKAEWGTLFRDENRAELHENIEMTYDEGEVTSRLMTAWLEDDRYIFEEDVIFIRSQDGDELRLESLYLELDQVENTFYARDEVKIDYNQRILKADEVNYIEADEIMELTGNVHIEEEDGWVKGEKAVFYLDAEEDKFTVEDQVEIEMEL